MLLLALTLASCGGSPTDAALTISVQDVKTLRLSWADVDQASGYRLLVETSASSVRKEVATLPAHTTRHDVRVFLPDQVNARYTLLACNASGCFDVATTDVAASLLNDAVGHFTAAAPDSRMGHSIALSTDGGTLAVGAPADDSQVPDSGSVYLFTRGPTGWALQALLKAAIPGTGDRFGQALALASDGQRLAVGASGHAQSRGAIYVFERLNGQWTQQWFQPDPFPWTVLDDSREFGRIVALSGDGNTLAAGRLDGDVHMLIFGHDNGNWTSQAAIPGNGVPEESACALSDDGNTLVVGRAQATTGAGSTGVAEVYQRVLGAWQGPSVLTASNAGDGDGFGGSVAIAGDGQTIAVGAIFEDSNATGINGPQGDGSVNSGALYVFSHSGSTWDQQAYIKASNTGEADAFGYAVSLSGDGSTLAVTAVDEDSAARGLHAEPIDNTVASAGAAYLFRREGAVWWQSGFVKAPDTGTSNRFGFSIDLAGDGQALAAGLGGGDSGAAYLY